MAAAEDTCRPARRLVATELRKAIHRKASSSSGSLHKATHHRVSSNTVSLLKGTAVLLQGKDTEDHRLDKDMVKVHRLVKEVTVDRQGTSIIQRGSFGE